MNYFFNSIFCPDSVESVGVFYLVWISAFMLVHIGWDAASKNTENFHLGKLKYKVNIVYEAATFCSSFLLLLALIEPRARSLAGDIYLPFALAGFSGIIQSISALCPYSAPKA